MFIIRPFAQSQAILVPGSERQSLLLETFDMGRTKVPVGTAGKLEGVGIDVASIGVGVGVEATITLGKLAFAAR